MRVSVCVSVCMYVSACMCVHAGMCQHACVCVYPMMLQWKLSSPAESVPCMLSRDDSRVRLMVSLTAVEET